jgi:hypothetical protein
MDRSGPVEAAVRAAGYTSEDGEGSEEGSSVEEEEHEEERGREGNGGTFVSRRYSLHDDAVPAYSSYGYSNQATGNKRGSGIEIGPNGYAVSSI